MFYRGRSAVGMTCTLKINIRNQVGWVLMFVEF